MQLHGCNGGPQLYRKAVLEASIASPSEAKGALAVAAGSIRVKHHVPLAIVLMRCSLLQVCLSPSKASPESKSHHAEESPYLPVSQQLLAPQHLGIVVSAVNPFDATRKLDRHQTWTAWKQHQLCRRACQNSSLDLALFTAILHVARYGLPVHE